MSTLLHKAADPHIDLKDPWKNDDFERKEYGERLTRLVTNTPGSFVIALKAPWGAGKSIFLKRWEAHLELPETADKPYVPVVHVDAWRNDYLEDPLLAFVEAITERARRDGGVKKHVGIALSRLAEHSARAALPLARAATAMSTAGVSELVPLAAESLDSFAKHWLERAAEHRKSERGFQENLEKLRNALCRKPKDPTTPTAPLVLVIDELDRCRPDFAIKALERIKHFFGVPGIVFVIATDGDNLPNAVKTLYGTSVDGERYLRKFFDYEFHLPLPSHELVTDWLFKDAGLIQEICATANGASYQHLRNELLKGHLHEQADVRHIQVLSTIEHFKAICRQADLPIRDCTQAATILIALIRSTAATEALLPPLLALSVVARFCTPRIFDMFVAGTYAISELVAHNKSHGPDWQAFVQKMEPLWSQDTYLAKEFLLLLDFRTYQADERTNRLRGIAEREKGNHRLAAHAAFKHSLGLGTSTAERQLATLLTIIGKTSGSPRT